MSTRLLASAQACAQRAQLSYEGLGRVSNILLLTWVGAGLMVSFLSGLMIGRGLRMATSGFADSGVLSVDLP